MQERVNEPFQELFVQLHCKIHLLTFLNIHQTSYFMWKVVGMIYFYSDI